MTDLIKSLDELLAAQDPEYPDALSYIKSTGTPGVSVAVLTNGEIEAYTVGGPTIEEAPHDASTLFQACSISKPICGLAVLRAVQEKRLDLSAPITKYLAPELQKAITRPAMAAWLDHVTLTHLLSHTSGLKVHGFPGYHLSKSPPLLATILSGSKGSNTEQICLEAPPGLRHSYSGGGFTVIQAILESVYSKPYAEILKELVFDPLGMDRSMYHLPSDEKNIAVSYDTAVNPSEDGPYHVLPELGAAGLWTTPTDLLKAVRAIQNSVKGESDFLTLELARTLLTEIKGAMGWTGAGWVSPKGTHTFVHGGSNDPGFRCAILGVQNTDSFYEDSESTESISLGNAEGGGIAIMTNSRIGFEAVAKLQYAVSYLRQWPGSDALKLQVVSGENTAVPFKAPNTTVDSRWKEWVGKWKVDGEGSQGLNVFEILEDPSAKDRPVVRFGSSDKPDVRLSTAAMAPALYGPKANRQKGIDLVVDGMEMLFRLGFKDDEPKKEEDKDKDTHTVTLWLGWSIGDTKLVRVTE